MKKTLLSIFLIGVLTTPFLLKAEDEEFLVPEKIETQKLREAISDGEILHTSDYLDITIKGISYDEKSITVYVSADKFGSGIGFGKDGIIETEKITFHNPSTLAPSGQTEKVCNDRGDCFIEDIMEENATKAFSDMISNVVRIISKNSRTVVPGTLGHSTDVFFASADAETVRSGVDETFTSIRSGNGTSVETATNEYVMAGLDANTTSNHFTNLWRSIFIFDTSSLSDTTVVSNATLSLYDANSKLDTFSTTPTYVVVSAQNSSPITSGNYQTNGNTALSNQVSFSVSQYNDFTLNATGINAISTTSTSPFATKTNWDQGNSSPTWGSGNRSYRYIRSTNYTGTTYDPILTVVHAEPVVPTSTASSTPACSSDICQDNLEHLYLWLVTGIFLVAEIIGYKIIL